MRIIGSSEYPDGEIHHVFLQAKLQGPAGPWINVDATYPDFELGQAKPEITAAEIL